MSSATPDLTRIRALARALWQFALGYHLQQALQFFMEFVGVVGALK